MTTLAIRDTDAAEAIASFDPNLGLTEDQVQKIVEDLDEWDQEDKGFIDNCVTGFRSLFNRGEWGLEKDGVIELRSSMHDTKVRLAEIIEKRTGLKYVQAPIFYDKMQEVFLDRRIPMPPSQGEREEAPAVELSQASVEAEASAALSGWVAWSGKEGSVVKRQADDGALVAQLRTILKASEARNFKGMNVLQARQMKMLMEDLELLEQRRSAVATTVSQMGGPQSERVLSHPSLRRELGALRHSRTHLENMVAYYWNRGKVRESDVITVRRYIGALGSLNRGLQTVPRQLPTVIGPARAAAASIASPLRQSSQGLQALLGRLSPGRGTAAVAAVVAIGGLVAFGLQAAAEAASPEQEKSLEIVDPSSLQRKEAPKTPEQPEKPAPPDEKDQKEKVWQFHELPDAIPLIDVSKLPPVGHPHVTARRK